MAGMGLMDRVGRVVRAQVTHWVSQAEDPERILEQTVQDMQSDVVELRQAVAQAVATLKRTERQLVQADANASEWQRRAFMAGENGQEGLAKEALAKRQGYITTAEALASQIVKQRQLIDQLKQNMRLLDSKLGDAKTKKDMYVARARSAAATNRMNDLLERTNPEGSGAVFDRMEEKILTMEAQADLTAEMQYDPVAEQFAQIESQAKVEGDYQRLRQQIDLPGTGPSNSLDAQAMQSRPPSSRQPQLPNSQSSTNLPLPNTQRPSQRRPSHPAPAPQPENKTPELPPWN